MATSTNDIKIRYVLDTSDLKEATQQFDRLSAEEKDVAKEADKLKAKLKQVGQEGKEAGQKASEGMSGLEEQLASIGGMVAGAFAIEGIIEFGKAVFGVTATFESLQTVLGTTLGGNAPALKTMKMIKEIAASTPFSVEELTASFVKLANQGFTPTAKEIVKLGDLASSTGKSFDMLAEAVIDAQVGEFERLKEFGIRSSKQGDMIQFTFKGITTEVKNQSEAIQQYLIGLGDVAGVMGSMEAQSQTLNGAVSNLGDTWDTFLNNVGTKLYPVFSNALLLTSSFINDFNKLFGMINTDREKLDERELKQYEKVIGEKMTMSDEELKKRLTSQEIYLKTVEKQLSETTQKVNDNYTGMVKKVTAVAPILAPTIAAIGKSTLLAGDKMEEVYANQVALAKGELTALKEIQKEREKATITQEKETAKATKTKAKGDPLKAVKEAYQEELRLAQQIKEQEIMRSKLAGKGKEDQLALEADFQEKVISIKLKYLNKGIGITKQDIESQKLTFRVAVQTAEEAYGQLYQKEIDAQKKKNDEKLKEEKEALEKLSQLREKAARSEAAWEQKLRDQAEREKQEKIQATFDLTQNLLGNFSSLYQTSINNEIAAMNKRYDNEIVLAEGNEQKIQELNNRRADEEKRLKTKAFQAEQAAAVAKVIFETAAIVAKWASNPVTAGLAALTLANQAAQIGFIMAQPVPEFAEGTKGKPFKGGKAMVGEKGIEKVVTASGKVYFTPPTATLIDLPSGSQVIPNHALSKQELFWAGRMSGGGQASNPMYGKLDELGSILKSLPITQLNMDERGFEKYIRTERRTTKILNNRFRS